MKKIIAILFVAALLVSASGFAAGGNLEGRAKAAAVAAGCLDNTKNIDVTVAPYKACELDGESLSMAWVWEVPFLHCKESDTNPCPRPYITLKAEVLFDCDGKVSTVICF